MFEAFRKSSEQLGDSDLDYREDICFKRGKQGVQKNIRSHHGICGRDVNKFSEIDAKIVHVTN